jgi:hypothetical protein
MATEIQMRREFSRLVPATPYDLEQLEQLPQRKTVKVVVTQARSLPHQRFYWALLGHVCKAHPIYKRSEQLHLALKFTLGYIDHLKLHTGQVVPIVSSTSFAKMDQPAFKLFFDSALELMLREIVPDVRRKDLLAPVEQMLGMRYGDLWAGPDERTTTRRERQAG